MSKRILWIVAVAVTAFALSLSAIAQPPGGPPGGGLGVPPGGGPPPGMGPGGMGGMMGGFGNPFANPEIVKLLELTPEQVDSLQKSMQEAGTEIREEMRKAFESGTQPNPEEIQKRMEKFMDGIQERTSKVLKPEQQTKVKEVAFQLSGGLETPLMGPLGMRTLDILDLTADQKEKIRKIQADREAESRTAREGFDFRNATPEDWEKIRVANEALNKKYAGQITAILTPEQKAKAEKLTAGAPALREKLGIPAPGQPGGRQRGQEGQGREQYTPGDRSWRPGQGAPNDPPPPPRQGNFPRSQ